MGASRRRLETQPSSRAVKIQGARRGCPKETGNAVLWACSSISGLLACKNALLEFTELFGSGARQPRRKNDREGFGNHSAPRVDRNCMSLGATRFALVENLCRPVDPLAHTITHLRFESQTLRSGWPNTQGARTPTLRSGCHRSSTHSARANTHSLCRRGKGGGGAPSQSASAERTSS